jgi:hypothetical protein
MIFKRPDWLIVTCCCLLSLFANAQQKADNYIADWKKVDSLMDKGLSKSAENIVTRIYTRARAEKNEAQYLKALIFRAGMEEATNDEGVAMSITGLEKEIQGTNQPARSILQNILANKYWSFLQQHRYQLYNRTETINFKKDDIATWGPDDFHRKIDALFMASIQNEKLLVATRLDGFDPIIVKGNVRALRPNLFDLLANDALNYFETDERDLNRPAYAFEIDDPAVFSDAPTFARHRFKTADSLSMHYRALLLQQRLIALHLDDARPDALLDIDQRRLQFAHSFSVAADKDELYMQALERISSHWGQLPAASEAWYLQAKQHFDNAASYDPLKDTADRYEYVKAKNICDKVVMQKDSSEGKIHCLRLLSQINERLLSLQIENVNMPDEPIRVLVSSRNVPRLYGRIVRIDRTAAGMMRNLYQVGAWQKMMQLPLQQSFIQSLPETGDFQSHHTEIKIDALPIGEYALIACPDPSFQLEKQVITMVHFYVSAIAYINNGPDYFVVHREKGQPLPGATVQVWSQKYDYKKSRFNYNPEESYRTDSHGHFRLNKRPNTYNNSLTLEITAGADHLFISDNRSLGWSYPYQEAPITDSLKYKRENLRSFFFMDRSIYRPGQTIYFKGIVVTRDFITHHPRIVPNFQTKIILYDANRGKVDSMVVTTNEYGSYRGSFRLPSNLLNGEFSIADDSTRQVQPFSVEEYKRPLFFVSYDTLRGSYRIGDTIRVKGAAKAYSGNIIDGATVKYRVTREVRYPCYDCWPMPGRRIRPAGSQEIAHGTTTTNAKGGFDIAFPAIPDRSIGKEGDPIFAYNISADVTDINGETHSESTRVEVGYKALVLSVDMPAGKELPTDSLHMLLIGATNLSGNPESVQANISIHALKAPDRLIRERLWEIPDQFAMTREEWLRYFPYDEYGDENNVQNWEKTSIVYEQTDTTGKLMILPKAKRMSPGWYVIEAAAKDKYGQTVRTASYIHLYDGRTGDPGYPQYDWASRNGATVQPGDKVTLTIGSSAESVFVIRNVEKISDTVSGKFDFFALDKGSKTSEFPVMESDRGGFGIFSVFVKDNRFYTHPCTIDVPWTNKELTINYETYRDKVLPGSEEKWKVTINGQRKDRVLAELLASMYDASLDQFTSHSWSVPHLYPEYNRKYSWQGEVCFNTQHSDEAYVDQSVYIPFEKEYDRLITSDDAALESTKIAKGMLTPPKILRMDAAPLAAKSYSLRNDAIVGSNLAKDKNGYFDFQHDMNPNAGVMGFAANDSTTLSTSFPRSGAAPPSAPLQIRKNFSETAFFFPDLRTDDSGSVSFSFTMPEALTRWKTMIFAHTKDLAFGYSEKTIVTQKQLMVQPNLPRFLREGDRMELGVKVVNLSDSEMTGQIELQLTDPSTGLTTDGIFSNRQANQYFTVAAGQSAIVDFPIDIPYQYNKPLSYRIIARSKTYSDGEEAALPVVSNRMLVTESLPLNMPGDGTKEFQFSKLLHSDSSETLNHHALTVEFTSNPAWYAVQALPYLMEYPYECAEQSFNRFYANALATNITHSSPKIQAIFDQWRTTDTAALLSNLEKNQELKSVLLQETPWVLEGKTESQQKQHIALLFDMVRMSRELESSLAKIQQMQSPNGGFVWFKGGPDDRYITQYILTGIGRLQKLNAIPSSMAGKVQDIVKAALPYLDGKIKSDYDAILREKKSKPSSKKPVPVWIGELPVDYLYMRSFFPQYGIPGSTLSAISYFRKQAQQQWLQYSKYMQGMIALALFRTGDIQTAKNIIASLKETAIRDEEKGMYWKGMEGGYYWWQAPIETQSLLIEAFHEVGNSPKDEAALKTWLLKQKQTHNWSTSKATADACYALLIPGQSESNGSARPGASPSADNWLNVERNVEIQLGNKPLPAPSATEAGTGYFKQVVDGAHVLPSMGNIKVTMRTAGSGSSLPAWGAVYWQYFENLDKISAADNAKAPLRLTKKLFIEKNTDRGPILEPLTDNAVLHPGDKVKVRIELRSDRDLEYVHMKDMRASCMEPVNVLSQYKWQDGLGYYESTKDASTDFFFGSLPKGTYVFEYPLFVGQKGNFSNGVTSIECMYAPEFGFHSEGIRVNVEEVTP